MQEGRRTGLDGLFTGRAGVLGAGRVHCAWLLFHLGPRFYSGGT